MLYTNYQSPSHTLSKTIKIKSHNSAAHTPPPTDNAAESTNSDPLPKSKSPTNSTPKEQPHPAEKEASVSSKTPSNATLTAKSYLPFSTTLKSKTSPLYGTICHYCAASKAANSDNTAVCAECLVGGGQSGPATVAKGTKLPSYSCCTNARRKRTSNR